MDLHEPNPDDSDKVKNKKIRERDTLIAKFRSDIQRCGFSESSATGLPLVLPVSAKQALRHRNRRRSTRWRQQMTQLQYAFVDHLARGSAPEAQQALFAFFFRPQSVAIQAAARGQITRATLRRWHTCAVALQACARRRAAFKEARVLLSRRLACCTRGGSAAR